MKKTSVPATTTLNHRRTICHIGTTMYLLFAAFSVLPSAAQDIAVPNTAPAPQSSAASDHVFLRLAITAGGHAALPPCNCPIDPSGGVARRKAAIDALRHQSAAVVAIEFGGFIAGGPLDEATVNEATDSAHTRLYLNALKSMGYAALFSSESDRRWRRDALKALAANDDATGRWLKTVLKSPGFSMTLPIRKSPDDAPQRSVVIQYYNDLAQFKNSLKSPSADSTENPSAASVPAYRIAFVDASPSEIAEAVTGRVDSHRIVLTPRGQAVSAETLRTPGATIIHIGRDAREVLVLEFVSTSGMRRAGSDAVRVDIKKIGLGKGAPEDATLAAAVADYTASLKKTLKAGFVVPIDYYGALDCGYCHQSWPDLMTIRDHFKDRISITIHMLVRKNPDGTFRAGLGHGTDAQRARILEETKRILLIRKYAPDKVLDYMDWRMKNLTDPGWDRAVKSLGIPPWRIRGAMASGEAKPLLEQEAAMCDAVGIRGTPTVFLFNRLFKRNLTAPFLATAICSMISAANGTAPECDGVPVCHDDLDCKKPGSWGVCRQPGTGDARCEYEQAVAVRLKVLYDSRMIFSNHTSQIESIMELLPGAVPQYIDLATTPDAAAIIADLKPERLPAYFLDAALKQSRNYKDFSELIDWRNADWAYIKPDLVGANLIINRPRVPGRLDVFAGAHSKKANDLLLAVIAALRTPAGENVSVAFHWIAYRRDNGQLIARNGLGELEESARRIAISLIAPDKLLDYLNAQSKTLGTSYWDEPLSAVGIDPAVIRHTANTDPVFKRMFQDADMATQLAPGTEFFLLIRNREVMTSVNPLLIEHVIQVLSTDPRPDHTTPAAPAPPANDTGKQ